MALLRVLLVAAAVVAAVAGKDLCRAPKDAYPPDPSRALPVHVIDLDLPAQQRWAAAVTPLSAQIHDMVYWVVDFLPADLRNYILEHIAGKEDEILAAFPADYGDEIRGIAYAIGMDIPSLILFNIAYELEGGCTSIVAQDENGHVYHARNLDFGLFVGWDKSNKTWELTEKLRPLLFNAQMMKNGTIFYNATYFAGYVGLLTGMKTGGFSISVDTRFDDTFWSGLQKWFEGDHSGNFLSFTTRQAMENLPDYATALTYLNNTKMVGPSYIILGGINPGEGAVITRGGAYSYHLWTIANNLHNTSFYVIETNYDNWVKPPFFDDRRTPAEDCLNDMGPQGVGFPGLFNLLSGKPNLNLLTTYSTLMMPATGQFEAYMQDCEYPCPYW